MKLGQVLCDNLTTDLRTLLGRLFTNGCELGLNLKERECLVWHRATTRVMALIIAACHAGR